MSLEFYYQYRPNFSFIIDNIKVRPRHNFIIIYYRIQQEINNNGNLSSVSINQLSGKLKSKKELHTFLVQDCSAYLPPVQSTNVYFFKAIMSGDKEYIKRDKVMVAAVPQIEGLTVEDMLSYSKQKPILMSHLPDERDWVHIDRKWVTDVIYTLDKNNFQAFINAAMKKRKEKLELNQNLLVEMKPEFANALQSCLNFSTSNGRAVNLVKGSSKRKRTREELEEVKDEEEELKQDRQSFLQQVKRIRQEKAELEATVDQLSSTMVNSSGLLSVNASKIQSSGFSI